MEKQADWALGIVTGNNKKYLSNELQNGYEEIITGKDIENLASNKHPASFDLHRKNFNNRLPKQNTEPRKNSFIVLFPSI
jgi:hypothetical protein